MHVIQLMGSEGWDRGRVLQAACAVSSGLNDDRVPRELDIQCIINIRTTCTSPVPTSMAAISFEHELSRVEKSSRF